MVRFAFLRLGRHGRDTSVCFSIGNSSSNRGCFLDSFFECQARNPCLVLRGGKKARLLTRALRERSVGAWVWVLKQIKSFFFVVEADECLAALYLREVVGYRLESGPEHINVVS